LPELGEDEVKSAVFDDLLKDCLPEGALFQTRYEQTEMLISCKDLADKSLQKQVMKFKMSKDFTEILKRYVNSLPAYHIEFTDIVYDDKTIFTREFLKERLLQMNNNITLAAKLEHLRLYIFDEIHKLRKERMPKLLKLAQEDPKHPYDWEEYARALSIEEHTCLAKQVDEFITLNIMALYKKLFTTKDLLLSLSEGVELPSNIEEILLYTEGLPTSSVKNEDALALTYMQLLTSTNHTYKQIRQVVVDEAQDYYDIHFEILKKLFPNTRYTILGDVNQTIEKQENMDLYKRITKIMQPKSSCLMTMNKSFRCTKEILSFSMRYLNNSAPVESFNRSGDTPQIIGADDVNLLDDRLIEEANYSKDQGYQSIGIICKDARQAEILYDRLKGKTDLHLVCAGGNLNSEGVFIIPITMSKGLEFDSVLVYGADRNNYNTDDDRKLLYIAGTRALHRLNLFYAGEISPLIGGDKA
jgi:DNA helicase-2/ATP-dependent DNA helicase PcrA